MITLEQVCRERLFGVHLRFGGVDAGAPFGLCEGASDMLGVACEIYRQGDAEPFRAIAKALRGEASTLNGESLSVHRSQECGGGS